MPQKSKSYWWKSGDGKWHYHKPGTPPATNAVETATSKPTGATSVSTGATASGGRPATSVGQSVDPGFYKPTPKPVPSGGKPTQLPQPMTPVGGSAGSKMTPPPGGGKAQAKADWKAGWQPSDKKSDSKSSVNVKRDGNLTKSKIGVTVGRKGSVGRKNTGGSGLTAVSAGQGSRKVYDDARTRLLKKKRGSQSYRP